MLTNIKIMKRSIITKQLAAILSCRGLLLNAYVIPTNRMISTNRAFSNTRGITIQRPLIQSNTRLYSSLSNNMNTLLKDAPLGIRMMGKLVAPLVSSMAETFREQSEIIGDVLYEAEELILGDDTARSVLGGTINVGAPFSQSSSSSSINGVTTAKIQASFPVQGEYSSGVATVVASSGGSGKPDIESLVLEVMGRRYSIGLIKSAGGDVYSGQASVVGKKKVRKGDIIDAEFVEK